MVTYSAFEPENLRFPMIRLADVKSLVSFDFRPRKKRQSFLRCLQQVHKKIVSSLCSALPQSDRMMLLFLKVQ